MLKKFPLQLGEAGAASCFDVLNLDIINEGPANAIMKLGVVYFGLVCFLKGCVYARTKPHAGSQRY